MVFLCMLWFLAHSQTCMSFSRQEILMRHLFEDMRYFRNAPSKNSATHIHIETKVDSVDNVDEKEQTVTIELRQHYSWIDERLQWNETEFGGLTHFGCPQDKLWLPDLNVLNSKAGSAPISGFGLLRVESSGMVTWTLSTKEPTLCTIDVTLYPFDSQTCYLVIGTIIYDISVQDLVEYLPFVSNSSIPVEAWSLESGRSEIKTKKYRGGTYRLIKYTFHIRRERAYYLVSVVLPAIFLSAALPVPFSLPVEGGERMGVSVSALTTLSVYFSVVSDDVPRTSRETPIFAIYLNILLAIASLCVLCSMAVIRIHGRSSQLKVGPLTAVFVRKILARKISTVDQKVSSSHHEDSNKIASNKAVEEGSQSVHLNHRKCDAQEVVTWSMVAEAIDRLLFVVASLLISLMTLIVLFCAFVY